MRTIPSNWREWLSAVLLPFKIYIVATFVGVVVWQIIISIHLNRESSDRAMSDFAYTKGNYLKLGYFLSSIVLILGGIIQLKISRKSSFLNITFGIIAFFFGWFLQ